MKKPQGGTGRSPTLLPSSRIKTSTQQLDEGFKTISKDVVKYVIHSCSYLNQDRAETYEVLMLQQLICGPPVQTQ